MSDHRRDTEGGGGTEEPAADAHAETALAPPRHSAAASIREQLESDPTLALTTAPVVTWAALGERDLEATIRTPGDENRPASNASPLAIDAEERYAEVGLLGRGGMGEVHAIQDRIVGRLIARKTLRANAGSVAERAERHTLFLREAQVQGQLEHPAVVPVYDLGRTLEGDLFFTMKRVSGQTLAEVIGALHAGGEARIRYGRHRLLATFLAVCQCIDYAHSRGVVHRDLKPRNIMLGDFGEVYVLDWGVARVGSEGDVKIHMPASQSGISGTPGYMPPEQITAYWDTDVRSDVYALGAILFELLTWEPLHRGASPTELLDSTRRGSSERIAESFRRADVPPELEEICSRATALRPENRHASVRELADDIERFLEGDRDLELRRDIAEQHIVAARGDVALALRGGAGSDDARRRALGGLGRALALQPESPEASRLLRELLTTPPQKTPPEVQAAIEEDLQLERQSAGRSGGYFFAAMGIIGGALYVVFRADGPALALFVAASLAAALVSRLRWRDPSPRTGVAIALLAGLAIASTSVLLGPVVLTPALAMAMGVVAMTLQYLGRLRLWYVAVACLVILVPAVLEVSGVLETSYVNVDGAWLIRSKGAQISSDRVYPFGALVASVIAILCCCAFVWRMSNRVAELRRQLQLYSWQVSQLVPEHARERAPESSEQG